jgi:ABC-type transport system involved in multi-copper enzyme maturation permease subunit
MKSRLKYEWLQIFSMRISLFLILIFIISLLAVNSGISDYKSFLDGLNIDIELDDMRANYQFSYDVYSIFGHRSFIAPSPLIIFFNKSDITGLIESNIDNTEVIQMLNNTKGSSILKKAGSLLDFGRILKIFGPLFMIFLGVLSTKNKSFFFESEKKLIPNVVSRIVILDFIFIFLMGLMFMYSIFSGINFSRDDFQYYLIFILFTLLYLNFSFLIGLFISSLFKKFNSGLLASGIIWAMIIIITPEIRYINTSISTIYSAKMINIKKTEKLFTKELKWREQLIPLVKSKSKSLSEIKQMMGEMFLQYMGKEYQENKTLEQKLHNQLKSVIRKSENLSCFIPYSFYTVLQENISSKGYYTYISFVEFVMEMRDNFMKYIYQRRYKSNDKKVIPFVKKGGTVFHSKSKLPDLFVVGVVSTLIFSLIFLFSAYYYFRRNIKQSKRKVYPANPVKLEQAKSFFMWYRRVNAERLFKDASEEHQDVCTIHNISGIEYDPGTGVHRWLEFICAQEGLDRSQVMEYLGKLGVEETDLKKASLPLKGTLLKKIYLCLKLAEKKEVYVLDDFLKAETREFENQCKALLQDIPCRVLYISTDKLSHEIIEEEINTEFKVLAIDLFDDTLVLR